MLILTKNVPRIIPKSPNQQNEKLKRFKLMRENTKPNAKKKTNQARLKT